MIWARRAANAVLTLLALAGLVGGLLFVGMKTGHLQTFMFTSGSMQPVYRVDDAVVSRHRAAADLQVGDVVTVPLEDGRNVTHRIVEIAPGPTDTSRELTLRGDANTAEDPTTYVVEDAFVTWIRIPQGGAVIETVRQPLVGIPLAAGAVGLIGFVMLAADNGAPRRRACRAPACTFSQVPRADARAGV
jgi:signal peptidase